MITDQSYFLVRDSGYAAELGNYEGYIGVPKEEEVLRYARLVLDVRNLESYGSVFLHICFLCSKYHFDTVYIQIITHLYLFI
jgi:hypothetical protein